MLLNKSAVKQFILEYLKSKRPHLRIGRVSKKALDHYEALLTNRIMADVFSHPTKGKTFYPVTDKSI